MKENYNFNDLISIMEKLRSENGCPWDKEQTHQSLKQYLLEETYEVIDAIEKDDKNSLCEELGDVLLQVIFHAQIACENNNFTIDDVINSICKKMISRHTHIFGDDKAATADDVIKNWENIKKKEKGIESYTQAMKNVPVVLPALVRAMKIQKKAANSGFDFENVNDAVNKLNEEIDELKDAILYNNYQIAEEIGDVLFSIVNISRFFNLNPEFTLTNAIEKFINRFEFVEKAVNTNGLNIQELSQNRLDDFWNESKKYEEEK